MIRVKICGIQSLEEAHWAVDAGADALGFIFVPSSQRYIEPKRVQQISVQIPPFVSKVGVFVGETPEKVAMIARQCSLDTIQLHGGEDPELYHEIPVAKVKVISFSSQALHLGTLPTQKNSGKIPSLPLRQSPHSLQGILLDSTHQGQIGGTGVPLPWQDLQFQGILREVKETGYPVILAGGLNPENILKAIEDTRPYGVDVSSGVERNGHKDRQLIQQFVSSAKDIYRFKSGVFPSPPNP